MKWKKWELRFTPLLVMIVLLIAFGMLGAAVSWYWLLAMPVVFFLLKPAPLRVRFVMAAARGDLIQLAAMMGSGMGINTRGDDGETALIAAAKAGQQDALQLLIDAGADLVLRDRWGYTAKRGARLRGYPGAERILAEAGAKEP